MSLQALEKWGQADGVEFRSELLCNMQVARLASNQFESTLFRLFGIEDAKAPRFGGSPQALHLLELLRAPILARIAPDQKYAIGLSEPFAVLAPVIGKLEVIS